MPAHPSQSTISFRKSNESFSPKKSGFRYQSPTKSSAAKQKNPKKEPQNNLYTSPTQQDDSLITDKSAVLIKIDQNDSPKTLEAAGEAHIETVNQTGRSKESS